MAYPARVYDLVCEDQDIWTNEQHEIFRNFLWFAEAFGFAFEIHRYNRVESLMNQTWYGSYDAILVFPANEIATSNLFFKRFQGTIGSGENLYAPDMLVRMVRELFGLV